MIINDCKLPMPVLHAMIANEYSAGKADYTASSLVYGPREYWGRKRYEGELDEYASRNWSAFTGNLTHIAFQVLLEKFNGMMTDELRKKYNIPKGKYVLEDRHTISFNDNSKYYKLEVDKKIGGAIDCTFEEEIVLDENTKLTTSIGRLYDWKTMSTTSLIKEDKIKDWTIKANLYRWLKECTGSKIDKLTYVPLFKDWTATKADRSKNVEDIPCLEINLEMWNREKIEKFIFDTVSYIEKYRNVKVNEMPFCNEDQRWEKSKEYKVCKYQPDGSLGNALNFCTFSTQEEANNALADRATKAKKNDKYGIKIVGGDSVKCKSWCTLSLNNKCNFLTKGDK